jgi:hypothetical protein
MIHTNSAETLELHGLAKNIDYTLRLSKAKSVLVASDLELEGKSTFLKECLPILAGLYEKKVLVYDCQDADEMFDISLNKEEHDQFIQSTHIPNLDYINEKNLFFLKHLSGAEAMSAISSYFNEVSKDYDVVFVNMKTLRRAQNTKIPAVPLDGAIIVRSTKSMGKIQKHVTEELRDRQIPILGLVYNEGAV